MGWVKFSADFDYRWPSGAVTEFLDGMVVHVKKEVEDAAIKAKVAKTTAKPKEGDPAHETSGAKMDTDRPRRNRQPVVTGGHRPRGVNAARNALPDPADPAARRSEPLVVGTRTVAKTEKEPDPAPEAVETPIPPLNGSPIGADGD